jgi:predicted dehydrogenase
MESAQAAKARGLAVVIGFCWRYHPGMRGVFNELRSGRIGDVVAVHTTYHTSTLGKNPRKPEWTDMEFQLRNWWHFTWLSGDHVVEQAVHSIDRLSWAVGDRIPARVICLGGRAARSGHEHGNVYDHFAAIYEYDDGLRCYHTTRQIDGCPSDNTDYVLCERGRARINGWSPPYALLDKSGKEVWSYKGPLDRDMYQVEHDEFFASIRAGRPINTCERGARSTLMAIMARMAAYTGQTVTWDQAMNSKEDLTLPAYAFGPVVSAPVAVPGKTKFV